MFQRTIVSSAAVSGTGLHTGRRVRVRFLPAGADEGIVFVREDCANGRVPALWPYVSDTTRATTLMKDGVDVRTVEHFLAAAFALGVTNLQVVLDHAELPILDGSSAEYGALLKDAGVVDQGSPRRVQTVRTPLEFGSGSRRIKVMPGDELTLAYRLVVPGFAEQFLHYVFKGDDFFTAIGDARTFTTTTDLLRLRQRGLVQGLEGSPGFVLCNKESPDGLLEDLLDKRPISTYRYELPFGDVLSSEKPRHDDEAVRHKILDMVGDLALSGSYVRGRFEAFGTGHAETIGLLRILMSHLGDSQDRSPRGL